MAWASMALSIYPRARVSRLSLFHHLYRASRINATIRQRLFYVLQTIAIPLSRHYCFS